MRTFTLSEPTAFPEFNKKNDFDTNHEVESIELKTLKYKHFRNVMQYPEHDQMHYLIMEVTDLCEEDVGELTPDDTAEISAYIYDAMKKYLQLGKKIIGGLEDN